MMLDVTPRGYTGHEHLDVHGVIHMNGRIYDPHLARFLQADPFVEDTGTLNRYTYVHNNPLIYTDPSGHFSVKKWGKIALSIAITVYSGGSAAGASWGLWGTGAQVTAFQAGATVAVGGALSGAVASGTWEGAFYGAFTGLAFHNIGQTLGASTWAQGDFLGDYSAAGLAAKTVSHGITGGAITHMQGGRFGHGFLSSGVTAASSPYIATKFAGNRYAQGATAAIVGGTVSSATGGKFANGAVTAAMAFAFNELASSRAARQQKATELTDPWVSRYDPSHPDYHDYGVGPSFGCMVGQGLCDFENVALIVDSESVPFRFPRVDHGDHDILGLQPIRNFSPTPGVFINQTRPGHWFHDGRVVHAVFEHKGAIWYYSRGVGVGQNPGANNLIGRGLFQTMHTDVHNRIQRELLGRLQPPF